MCGTGVASLLSWLPVRLYIHLYLTVTGYCFGDWIFPVLEVCKVSCGLCNTCSGLDFNLGTVNLFRERRLQIIGDIRDTVPGVPCVVHGHCARLVYRWRNILVLLIAEDPAQALVNMLDLSMDSFTVPC